LQQRVLFIASEFPIGNSSHFYYLVFLIGKSSRIFTQRNHTQNVTCKLKNMAKIICTFCNEKGNKSKEHIWPQWLQIELTGSTKSNFRGTHISLSGVRVVSERNQSGKSLVFGAICENCNTGWMSNLESEFNPIFKKIKLDYNLIKTLNKKERNIISLWGLKTAMMINSGSNYRQIIPEIHYSHLYKYRQIPKNVKIDIGHIISDDRLKWEQSNINMSLNKKQDVNNIDPYDLTKNSYVITMQLENLGIKVSYYNNCKENGFQIPTSKFDKSIRIWPYSKNGNFDLKNNYKDISEMHMGTILIR